MKAVKQPEPDRSQEMTAPRPNSRRAVLGICVLLALAVFAVFGQTLRYEFVNYDDDAYVYENPHVIRGLTPAGIVWAFTHSYSHNWHPLTWLSHMLDCQLWGLNAGGHHLTNVLLHAANAVLLFLVLRRMMGLRSDKSAGAAATPAGTLWPSAFVAAVFAIHPLRVESVAWVAERKDVLSAFFFLLTLLMYARYVEKSKVRSPKSRVFYGLALSFFALGLMSKPMLVTLPFVLLLLDYWPLRRVTRDMWQVTSDKNSVSQPLVLRSLGEGGSTLPRLILEKLPLFLLAAGSSAVTLLVQERTMMSLGHLPLATRLLNAVVSCGAYVGQMVWPENLAVLYPYHPDMPVWPVAGAGVLLLSVTVVAFLAARRFPYLPVGWLWYLGMSAPVIGIVQVGFQSHADRYTYLPQIGLYVVVVWAVRDLTASWRHRRQVLGAAALSVIAALMVCAWKQTSYWRNSESLWTHTLACTTGNYIAYNNLGNAVAGQGRSAKAMELYRRAFELKPDYAEAHNNLGIALGRQGRFAEAIGHFQKALQSDPDLPNIYNNLGVTLVHQGRIAGAIEYYHKALELKPDYAEAHNNLGMVLAGHGQSAEAIEHFQKAVEFKPDYAEAHNNLGTMFLEQGRLDQAVEQFQKAIQSKPDYAEAYYNLGNAFAGQDRPTEAIECFQKAVALKPDYAEAHNNLGALLARQGRTAEAIQHYRMAIEMKPDHAKAHYNLGALLASQGQPAEAIEHFQKAATLANDQGNTALADAARTRLKLFETNAPFREKP